MRRRLHLRRVLHLGRVLDLRALLRALSQLVKHLLPIRGCLGVRRRRGLVRVSVLDCVPVVLHLCWLHGLLLSLLKLLDLLYWLHRMRLLGHLIRSRGLFRLNIIESMNRFRLGVDLIVVRMGGCFCGLRPRSRPRALCTDSRRDRGRTIVCTAAEVRRSRERANAGQYCRGRRFRRRHPGWYWRDWWRRWRRRHREHAWRGGDLGSSWDGWNGRDGGRQSSPLVWESGLGARRQRRGKAACCCYGAGLAGR